MITHVELERDAGLHVVRLEPNRLKDAVADGVHSSDIVLYASPDLDAVHLGAR